MFPFCEPASETTIQTLVNYSIYTDGVIGGFRHKGLARDPPPRQDTPDRRRSYRQVRAHPAIARSGGTTGGHEHRRLSPRRQPETLVAARDRELPDQFRLVGRNRLGCRFRRLPFGRKLWRERTDGHPSIRARL